MPKNKFLSCKMFKYSDISELLYIYMHVTYSKRKHFIIKKMKFRVHLSPTCKFNASMHLVLPCLYYKFSLKTGANIQRSRF